MLGKEYQLFLSRPPLFVIRKVERTSFKDVTPLSYYYILHGIVYQAPDLMSLLSSRLQTASHYLSNALDTSFTHYKYNPSKGYYWDFSRANEDESSKQAAGQQKVTQFQRDRVGPLLQEFFNRFPPPAKAHESSNGEQSAEQITSERQQAMDAGDSEAKSEPVEKKPKI